MPTAPSISGVSTTPDDVADVPITPWTKSGTKAIVPSIALPTRATLGTIAFVPLFVQGVIGTSATSSGVVLTPLMLGAVVTSFLSGQLVSRTGRYRPNTLVGPPVLALGMGLL